jgi:hypothetical protein
MSEKVISKYAKKELIEYIKAHPEMRLWQCIRNWSGQNFILASYFSITDENFESNNSIDDTFYWEGKNK